MLGARSPCLLRAPTTRGARARLFPAPALLERPGGHCLFLTAKLQHGERRAARPHTRIHAVPCLHQARGSTPITALETLGLGKALCQR